VLFVVNISTNVIKEQISDENAAILLRDINNGKMFVANSTAAVFYNLCNGQSMEDLIDAFISHFKTAYPNAMKKTLKYCAESAYKQLSEIGAIYEE
jgi:hypothetical protein